MKQTNVTKLVSEIVIEPSNKPEEIIIKLLVSEDGLLSLNMEQSKSARHSNLDMQTIDHARMSLQEIQKWQSWCRSLQA